MFSAFKPALADLAVAVLSPVNSEMRRLLEDQAHIDGILAAGAERAAALAEPVIRDVKRVVGFVG
jgi:tryptophanyl-tRNA synthetase